MWRLWGKSYQRPFQDIFAIQEEIAREISDNLRLKLTGREKKRLAKRSSENREAYQLYLKGRFFWNKRTEESIRKGIEDTFARLSNSTQLTRWPMQVLRNPTCPLVTGDTSVRVTPSPR